MSDPGTTYRTRDEVQKMRSTQDPIRGLQRYIEEWGVASEEELKAIDKNAKATVDQAVEEAKEAKANEQIRRKSGKEMDKVKEELKIKQVLQEAEQKKRGALVSRWRQCTATNPVLIPPSRRQD